MPPATVVTSRVPINVAAGQDGGKDLIVAEPAANSLAPGSQDPSRVEVPAPASAGAPNMRRTAAGAAENPVDMEEAGQLQQHIPEGPAAAASTSEGSRDEFSIDDVLDPTLELF